MLRDSRKFYGGLLGTAVAYSIFLFLAVFLAREIGWSAYSVRGVGMVVCLFVVLDLFALYGPEWMAREPLLASPRDVIAFAIGALLALLLVNWIQQARWGTLAELLGVVGQIIIWMIITYALASPEFRQKL